MFSEIRNRAAQLSEWAARKASALVGGRARAETAPAAQAANGEEPSTVRGIVRGAARGMLGQLIVFSLFINALSLAAPIFVLQVYDRVIPHNGMATLYGLLVGILAAILFDFLLKQARSRVVQMVALRVDAQLSRRLFSRLTGLPLAKLEQRSDAEWRMLLRDADAVRDAVAGPTAVLAIDLPFAIVFIGAIAFVAPPLAYVLLLWAPVYFGVAYVSSRIVARAAEQEQEAGRDQSGLAGELVSGRGTVQALGLGETLLKRWESAQADMMRRSVLRGAKVDAFSNLAGGMALMTSVTLTTVGAIAIIGLEMSMGGLVAANMLAARVVQPLSQAIGLWRGLARFREAAERLDPVLAESCEMRRGALARKRPSGELRIEKAEFSYPGAPAPALDKISLTLKPGAMTGIVGENGCGKSTLLKALQGLYPLHSGRVLLDGEDLRQFGREEIAAWIGYAPQEPFLFEGSVRDNIARGREDIPDETIRTAARLAGAEGFVTDLPEGFGASVGEAGRRFSPGQRQRIALARALVSNPAVLLLDEPTANLDINAEANLIAQLQKLKRNRAVTVVSHSRAVLEACDLIAVMHGGRIAMIGRGEEMLPRLERKPAPQAAAPSSPSQAPEAQPKEAAAS